MEAVANEREEKRSTDEQWQRHNDDGCVSRHHLDRIKKLAKDVGMHVDLANIVSQEQAASVIATLSLLRRRMQR